MHAGGPPDRQPEPDPAHREADLAQHQERRDRHRGPALLRARRRGLPGHRARPLPGPAPAQRRPGRLDDHPAVREERAVGPGRPHGVPEAARGGARLPPGAQVVEGQDPHAVPEHRLLRERRLRRGVGGARLLPGPGAPAGRHHRLQQQRPGRRRDARGGRAPGRDDRVALALRPGGEPAPRHRAPQPRALPDARAADHLALAVRRGRGHPGPGRGEHQSAGAGLRPSRSSPAGSPSSSWTATGPEWCSAAGSKIKTTIDTDLQRAAEQAIAGQARRLRAERLARGDQEQHR